MEHGAPLLSALLTIPGEPLACKSQLCLLTQHLTVQVHQQTLPPKIEFTSLVNIT